MSSLFFFHGLESGPHGSKFKALQAHFGSVESPDFRGMLDIEERYLLAEELTRGMSDLVLVGSSFGGLLASLVASRHPERVAGYVLCAPALHRPEAQEVSHVPQHAFLLHGREDDVVPAHASVAFAEQFGLPLMLVSDNHRLSNNRHLVVLLADQICENINAS